MRHEGRHATVLMGSAHDETSTPSLDGKQTIADRYEVLGLLGVGGMGAVYKVRDKELDEIVALKMLKREIADSPGIVERFRREVKLARRVTHPNVARTFDLGEHGGERFLTMELIEGESLQELLKRERQLTLSRVVEVVSAICAGLEAAHAAGIVHRDLKPDNVMIANGTGRVVITDFGIARTEDASAAARTAVPVGTPAYMSPEQVEASATIDARADIYALGAMTFELLTGHLPFEADSVFAMAAMRLTQPPPDPRVRRPDLPESVATLVRRCMARKPEDRPESAREITMQLATLTLPANEPVQRASIPSVAFASPAGDGSSKTVAVLPFRNSSGASADDYLVDGLTDDLIDALSMAPGLRVRPRGLVMSLKDKSGDPRSLGRELNVQVVIDGSLRASADAIRVSARMLSVEDGFQIWAKRFDGTRADVLRFGDEVAKAVADALVVSKPERPRMKTDPLALDLYLKGRHEYLKFWSEANDRAVQLLEQAHERAPDDALIMSGYASALARRVGYADRGDAGQIARSVAEKAVRVAPQLAEAHVALAIVHLHEPDPVATASSVVRALALSPLLPEAHDLRARLLSEVSDPRDAIAAASRAIALDPRLGHLGYGVIGRAYVELEDREQAARIYAKPPEDVDMASLFWLMRMRMSLWQRDEAGLAKIAEEIERVPPFASLSQVRNVVSFALAKRVPPESEAGLRARAALPASTKRSRAYWYQLLAEIRSYVGNDVIDDIASSVAMGLFDIAWVDRCQLLGPARQSPRFKDLRAEVAVRAARTLIELRGSDATLAS
jgi:eukaryotic-like serine/threonine-protein kinase